MTDALLSRLRALAEKATPAPWVAGEWNILADNEHRSLISEVSSWNMGGGSFPEQAKANHALIVALRNSLPSLLSLLEAGEKLAEALERIVSEDQRAEVDSDGEEHQADGFFAEIARAALAAFAAAKEGGVA